MDHKPLNNPLSILKLSRFWTGFASALERYFRMEIEGIEHLPKEGAAVIVPNHSGFSGLDVIMLNHIVAKHCGRKPKILAHRAYFDFLELKHFVSQGFGLDLTSTRAGAKVLRQDELLMIFPEGSQGNFKSSIKAYQLQPFQPGFLRLAIMGKAPIVPAIVLGAEETHLNLGSVSLDRFLPGYKLPLPLNLLPLPAKWKIRFLPPIATDAFEASVLQDSDAIKTHVRRIQAKMQRTIRAELKKRDYVFHDRFL